MAAPTPPVVQSHPSGISGLFWRQETLQKTQGVRRVTSSSPERASWLRRLATVAPVDPNRSDNECIVCRSTGEEGNDAEVALKTPTEACVHLPQVCIGCLQQVILAAVNSGDLITGIRCPSHGCPQRMGYHDVQKWATKEVFDRYDKNLLRDSLRTDGRYLSCVKPSCTAGQEHTGGDNNNIMTCYHCGTKQCFRHQTPWHEGLTCDQWDAQQHAIADQHEQKTEEWIQRETKGCPGPGCGKRIQKSEGCDHLICRRPGGCGHQFCWECLAPWLQITSGDNSRHYDSCKYYSGRPGKNPAPTRVTRRREPVPRPDRSASRTTEIPVQCSIPTTTPSATPASSCAESSGSSRMPTIPITSAGAFTSYAPGYAYGYPYPLCTYPYGPPPPMWMYPYWLPPPMWMYPYGPPPPMSVYSSPFAHFDDSHGRRREEDSSDTK